MGNAMLVEQPQYRDTMLNKPVEFIGRSRDALILGQGRSFNFFQFDYRITAFLLNVIYAGEIIAGKFPKD